MHLRQSNYKKMKMWGRQREREKEEMNVFKGNSSVLFLHPLHVIRKVLLQHFIIVCGSLEASNLMYSLGWR
jgi:hypothetical protein